MTFSQYACHQAVRRHLSGFTDYIWISDDLLANTLRRFTLGHRSRRHVGFAPGPLEARKRSAKRRMMNMAVAEGAGATDVGTLMRLGGGLEQSAWRWESPTTPNNSPPREEAKTGPFGTCQATPYNTEVLTKLTETPPLPSWLADYQPSPIAEPRTKLKRIKSRGLATAIGPASHGGPSGGTVKLIEGLNSCNCLVAIRKLLKSPNIKVEQDANCSMLAFTRLLDARVPLQTLLEFLDDASLNAPEAQNLQHLLSRLAKTTASDQDTEALGTWVRRHTSLGRLSEKDIGSVLSSVSHLGSGAWHRKLCSLIATEIWGGLQSSAVLQPKDLQVKTLQTLLEHISQNEWSDRVQSIGKSIVRSLSRSQLHDVHLGIAAFVRSWLFAMRTSTGIREQELRLSENRAAMAQFLEILPTKVAIATLGTVIAKELMTTPVTSQECQDSLATIVRLLEILPVQIANSSAASATSNIYFAHQQAIRKGRGGLDLLEPWLQTLLKSDAFRRSISCSAEWRAFEKDLSERRMGKIYLRGLSDRERCRFIIRHWILEDVGVHNVEEAASIVSNTLRCFEGLNQFEHGTAPYGHMFQALMKHTKAFDKITARLFFLLSFLDEIQLAVNIIRRLQKYRLPIGARLVAFVIKRYCGTKPASALALFESHPSLLLAGCPDLAESLIADPETGPDTAFRHLRRDGQGKAALNMSLVYRNASSLSNAQVRLMHKMALALANAAHLRPRIAFRFVHRCYTILDRGEGENLDPQLSRALTLAGIIRPLKVGRYVGTRKLRWILALVKNIEGEETAIELYERVSEWHKRASGLSNGLSGTESVLRH